MTRKEAKYNLKMVIESTTGFKIENQRFDRYWFDERRDKLKGGIMGREEVIEDNNPLVSERGRLRREACRANGLSKGFCH